MALFTVFLLATFPSLIFSLGTIIPLPKTNITLKGFTKLPFPQNVLSSGSLSFNLLGEGPYAGVTVVGPSGGLATTLVPSKNGTPYKLLLGIDAASNQNVYFTDASGVFGFTEVDKAIRTGDSTGRLLEYNPKTKKVTTLLSNLGGAAGVATDAAASYVLVSEFIAKRITKYWLKGEKAGTSEIFLTFTGNPNKIKRNWEGNYWVPLNYPRPDYTNAPKGVKFSPSGQILETVDFSKEYYQNITAVVEQRGKLFLSGLFIPYIGQYELEEYLYH
ncbi:protein STRICTOSIDINE SYNTHASE-LIKE 11-like [Coffea arabica]|uniref:Protein STRICTOSIDINE SYNTHASE-LIKE 11-like n=1 Tax=Coffea arabica TaxID=13443 RepID=A0ABM4U6H6_COFAR